MSEPSQRYISDELTHFVGRGLVTSAQYRLLVKIFSSGWLTHPPHENAHTSRLTVSRFRKLSQNEMYSPSIVCFCDIPVEYLAIHIRKYSPFGLSFRKEFILRRGGAPVRYVPTTGSVWKGRNLQLERALSVSWLDETTELVPPAPQADYFDTMITLVNEYLDDALERAQRESSEEVGSLEFWKLHQVRLFLDCHVFCFLKFFDPSLPDNDPNNYYFEREWRVLENVRFQPQDVKRVLLPSRFVNCFRKEFPSFEGDLTVVEELSNFQAI